MATKTIIMSWSRHKLEIGKLAEGSDAMATTLIDVGVINDKSTTLSTEDGESLTATATGGIVVAQEEGEPTVTLTTRIKEMSFDMESLLTGAEISTDKQSMKVKTNIVPGEWSVKLTPKNIGATGIKIRRTHVSFKPGSSEEEGAYVDLTFKVLACEDGELYTKFKVTADDWATKTPDAGGGSTTGK